MTCIKSLGKEFFCVFTKGDAWSQQSQLAVSSNHAPSFQWNLSIESNKRKEQVHNLSLFSAEMQRFDQVWLPARGLVKCKRLRNFWIRCKKQASRQISEHTTSSWQATPGELSSQASVHLGVTQAEYRKIKKISKLYCSRKSGMSNLYARLMYCSHPHLWWFRLHSQATEIFQNQVMPCQAATTLFVRTMLKLPREAKQQL